MQTFKPKRTAKRTAKQQKWDKLIAGGTPMFKNGGKKDKRARSMKGGAK